MEHFVKVMAHEHHKDLQYDATAFSEEQVEDAPRQRLNEMVMGGEVESWIVEMVELVVIAAAVLRWCGGLDVLVR